MSTTSASPPNPEPVEPADGGFELPPSNTEQVYKLPDVVAALEADFVQEKDSRKEERFYWICFSAFLGDVVVYRALDHAGVFTLLFMFQLVMLIGAAQRLGVDWAVQGLGWFLHWISERFKMPGSKD